MQASPPATDARLTPYKYGENLFGRDWETAQLLALLVAERVVLLYAISGAGKTSLIQAGLIPALEAEELVVSRVPIRVNRTPKAPALGSRNRYIVSTLLSLDAAAPAPLPEAALLEYDLRGYLEARHGVDGPPVVLLFDQFEEILTVDPGNVSGREEFFSQVGQLCRGSRYWALFSLRDDYVARLEPYLARLSSRPTARFRLGLLDAAGAEMVVRAEARLRGVVVEPAAARELVRRLRTVELALPDGTIGAAEGRHVEPVQLQAVLPRLLAQSAAAARSVGLADVAHVNVRDALGDYYDDSVAEIVRATGYAERELRRWVQANLFTAAGQRDYLRYAPGDAAVEGLPSLVVDALVGRYLLRREPVRDLLLLELAHDQLVRPVRERNAAWLQDNTHDFQLQARAWAAGRSPDLLIGGALLSRACRWADERPQSVTAEEREFLEASVRQQEVRRGLNLRDLGWGVIFAVEEDARVVEALRPLLELRRAQAGARYREYAGFRGHRVDPESGRKESARAFVERVGASTEAAPGESQEEAAWVPGYFLIVGSPERIPFSFQIALARRSAVGRVHFVAEEEYRRYAEGVCAVERAGPTLAPQAAFFYPPTRGVSLDTAAVGPLDAGSLRDQEVRRFRSAPLDPLVTALTGLVRREFAAWGVDELRGEQATRRALEALLAARPPTLLVTAGKSYDLPDAPALWGALACADWDGAAAPGPAELFTDADLPIGAPLSGMIAVLIASFSAGSSSSAELAAEGQSAPPDAAFEASISALARGLLAHMPSGAQALIGHVDQNLGYAYADEQQQRGDSTLFEGVLRRLLEGQTVGRAIGALVPRLVAALSRAGNELLDGSGEWFERLADLGAAEAGQAPATERHVGDLLSDIRDVLQRTLQSDELRDLRKYVIIGDPAARLPLE